MLAKREVETQTESTGTLLLCTPWPTVGLHESIYENPFLQQQAHQNNYNNVKNTGSDSNGISAAAVYREAIALLRSRDSFLAASGERLGSDWTFFTQPSFSQQQQHQCGNESHHHHQLHSSGNIPNKKKFQGDLVGTPLYRSRMLRPSTAATINSRIVNNNSNMMMMARDDEKRPLTARGKLGESLKNANSHRNFHTAESPRNARYHRDDSTSSPPSSYEPHPPIAYCFPTRPVSAATAALRSGGHWTAAPAATNEKISNEDRDVKAMKMLEKYTPRRGNIIATAAARTPSAWTDHSPSTPFSFVDKIEGNDQIAAKQKKHGQKPKGKNNKAPKINGKESDNKRQQQPSLQYLGEGVGEQGLRKDLQDWIGLASAKNNHEHAPILTDDDELQRYHLQQQQQQQQQEQERPRTGSSSRQSSSPLSTRAVILPSPPMMMMTEISENERGVSLHVTLPAREDTMELDEQEEGVVGIQRSTRPTHVQVSSPSPLLPSSATSPQRFVSSTLNSPPVRNSSSSSNPKSAAISTPIPIKVLTPFSSISSYQQLKKQGQVLEEAAPVVSSSNKDSGEKLTAFTPPGKLDSLPTRKLSSPSSSSSSSATLSSNGNNETAAETPQSPPKRITHHSIHFDTVQGAREKIVVTEVANNENSPSNIDTVPSSHCSVVTFDAESLNGAGFSQSGKNNNNKGRMVTENDFSTTPESNVVNKILFPSELDDLRRTHFIADNNPLSKIPKSSLQRISIPSRNLFENQKKQAISPKNMAYTVVMRSRKDDELRVLLVDGNDVQDIARCSWRQVRATFADSTSKVQPVVLDAAGHALTMLRWEDFLQHMKDNRDKNYSGVAVRFPSFAAKRNYAALHAISNNPMMRTAELISAVLSMEHASANSIRAAAFGMPMRERPASSLGELTASAGPAALANRRVKEEKKERSEKISREEKGNASVEEEGVEDDGEIVKKDDPSSFSFPSLINDTPGLAGLIEASEVAEGTSCLAFGLDGNLESMEEMPSVLSTLWSDKATTTVIDLRSGQKMRQTLFYRNVHHINLGNEIPPRDDHLEALWQSFFPSNRREKEKKETKKQHRQFQRPGSSRWIRQDYSSTTEKARNIPLLSTVPIVVGSKEKVVKTTAMMDESSREDEIEQQEQEQAVTDNITMLSSPRIFSDGIPPDSPESSPPPNNNDNSQQLRWPVASSPNRSHRILKEQQQGEEDRLPASTSHLAPSQIKRMAKTWG